MTRLAPYAKAIGALLGGLTPAIVIAVLAVHVDPTAAAALCTVLGVVGTYLAPANTPNVPQGGQHAADA